VAKAMARGQEGSTMYIVILALAAFLGEIYVLLLARRCAHKREEMLRMLQNEQEYKLHVYGSPVLTPDQIDMLTRTKW
jgi:hypothetical protein